ncbi:hypothetical protein [Candidatus Albibeggiatoa sp. nov. NOAA]|uniref:hypothetical protein n=1 Tax=Candidatus Albibeggiatoa sp. nov. NOAA TaxID=3162724 RepID=UPI0032FCFC2F|nr:hypothetical protein [Thiotrichaceae bacterium]
MGCFHSQSCTLIKELAILLCRYHKHLSTGEIKSLEIEQYIPLLESILGQWRDTIGDQYEPYKNHLYRVLNFCFALHQCQADDREKLIITACFHDLGIWPDGNVDYLSPSVTLAKQYLADNNKQDWFAEIELMIDLHHKCTATDTAYPLVEVFRKADWIDVSMGIRRFGLRRKEVKAILKTFPNLGFHNNLTRLTMKQIRQHPFQNPLPMMKW